MQDVSNIREVPDHQVRKTLSSEFLSTWMFACRLYNLFKFTLLGCAAQEVLVDPSRDESLIFELLDLKGEVDDAGSALWFLQDIANEQDAGDNLVGNNSPLTCLYCLMNDQLPPAGGCLLL